MRQFGMVTYDCTFTGDRQHSYHNATLFTERHYNSVFFEGAAWLDEDRTIINSKLVIDGHLYAFDQKALVISGYLLAEFIGEKAATYED